MTKVRYLPVVQGGANAVAFRQCPMLFTISVAVWSFLNWAVATFLFLSGYLKGEKNIMAGVLRCRFNRTLSPYIVWSLAYSLIL